MEFVKDGWLMKVEQLQYIINGILHPVLFLLVIMWSNEIVFEGRCSLCWLRKHGELFKLFHSIMCLYSSLVVLIFQEYTHVYLKTVIYHARPREETKNSQ